MESATLSKQSTPPEAPARSGGTLRFIVVAVLLIGGAAAAGLARSGKLHMNMPGHPAPAVAAAAPRVAPLNTAAYVVTSISMGQPSYAIINGVAHAEGDALAVPGVAGWKVKQITEGAVVLQNGAALASLPLSTPGMKPLDDQLHPLN